MGRAHPVPRPWSRERDGPPPLSAPLDCPGDGTHGCRVRVRPAVVGARPRLPAGDQRQAVFFLAGLHSDHVRTGRALCRGRRRPRHARTEPAADALPSPLPIEGLRARHRRCVLHLDRIVGSPVQCVRDADAAGIAGRTTHRAAGVMSERATASEPRERVGLRPEQASIPPDHAWNRLPMIGAGSALLGAAGCAILGAGNPKQFFFSWLVSFLFFLSLAIGALFFVLIQYASQGGWGIVVRRIGEITFATVPVMAALFLPVLLGLHDLYSWTVPGAADHDALLRWKAPYLNVPFFLIRAALYFAVWSFIALLYYRGSRDQDVSGDPRMSARLRRLAGPSLIVLALTQSFASVDWIVSLSPHWYSTMFGVYFFAGSFVGFIALLSIVAVAMRGGGAPAAALTPRRPPDIGKFLFAFTAFW